MDVLLLSTQSGDWEGLYIDAVLIEEGHRIDRDDMIDYAVKYGFKSSDIKKLELNDVDEEATSIRGNFHECLYSFQGNYLI